MTEHILICCTTCIAMLCGRTLIKYQLLNKSPLSSALKLFSLETLYTILYHNTILIINHISDFIHNSELFLSRYIKS